MSRKNWKDTVARFDADCEEALDYVDTNELFRLRKGARGATERVIVPCYLESSKLRRRKSAHNGANVQIHFVTKPKASDYTRETIRRPTYLDYLAEMAAEGIIFND